MTKYQFILLVLLVSFVTALVTGIVSVALINQAPQPVTQTIQRVIEKTVETVQKPLEIDEAKELELAALSRDILVSDIANRTTPAIVSIVATRDIPALEKYFVSPNLEEDFFSQFSGGTGFIVSDDGFIVTNKRVVGDLSVKYSVLLNDQRRYSAEVLARDPLYDIAILKIKPGSGEKFSVVKLSNSDKVKVGHTAIAAGNALGEFKSTISVGVISGIRRSIVAFGSLSGSEETTEVIQTDVSIYSGNSGGPLLNLKGEAIGLNMAVVTSNGNISFAIPINLVKKSLDLVKLNGNITYPYFGVRYVLITPEIKKEMNLLVDYGALVSVGPNGEKAVVVNSSAARAGIIEGDIILEFNEFKVSKDNNLSSIIQKSKVGDEITLKVWRDGEELTIKAVLGEI